MQKTDLIIMLPRGLDTCSLEIVTSWDLEGGIH